MNCSTWPARRRGSCPLLLEVWLLTIVVGCGPCGGGVAEEDAAGTAPDAGASTQDASADAGTPRPDAGVDAGADAGVIDAGVDAGSDAGALDAALDAGAPDAAPDAGAPDAAPDAGAPDAASEAGALDAGGEEAGPVEGGAGDTSAADAGEVDACMTCQIHPDCAARGGTCTMVDSVGDTCPAGSYNPFSGALAQCPTGALRLCCVPRGGPWSPCESGGQCSSGGCLSEAASYPVGGFCPSSVCDPVLDNCADYEVCLTVIFSAAMGMCMLACDTDDVCRQGWSCQAFPRDPFGASYKTSNVCWEAGAAGLLGLGADCAEDGDCLSFYCLVDPADGVERCTATCSDAEPCLDGYTCKPLAGCEGAGCGTCFPD